MSGRVVVGAALLVLLAAGCSKRGEVLAPPPAGTPPSHLSEVDEVFPLARSTGVPYDTDIWVRFREPLDPATVNERTVFFKHDTVRLPVTLVYDGPTRTLRLFPQLTLALLRTYTVEITGGVRTAAGRAIDPMQFWQFRTNGLRRLTDPSPVAGTVDESPFASLKWGRTEPSAGSIFYEVYQGADSAVVAARGAPRIYGGPEPVFIPPVRWGFSARVYWAVTSTNQTSNERLDGPVWSFVTLPQGLAVDSLEVPAAEWGYYDFRLQRAICRGATIASGSVYNNGMHFQLEESAAGLKLAGARLETFTSGTINIPVQRPAVHPSSQQWAPCAYGIDVPNARPVGLADGVRIAGTQFIQFASDELTAYLDAGARYDVAYGLTLRSNLNMSFAAPGFGARLWILYYRVPTAAAARRP